MFEEELFSEQTLLTIGAVDWDALSKRACRLYNATYARWSLIARRGNNFIRFLEIDNENAITVVARVPLLPEGGWRLSQASSMSKRISSEVATMRYVAARTNIPVPLVLDYSPELNGEGVGSPYILMTKVEGLPLSELWDDMDDRNREILLRQIVDILLEFSSHRFDRIGSLIQIDGEDNWIIDSPVLRVPNDVTGALTLEPGSTPFTSAIEFWHAYISALIDYDEDPWVRPGIRSYETFAYWFVRPLVPALYDTFLDHTGFPLFHADFDSQNIIVNMTALGPRITALVDWEFSRTTPTSSLCQYPSFIMDHPNGDDSTRERKIRDQMIFDAVLLEAETKHHIYLGECRKSLAAAFASCKGVFLFEKVICGPNTYYENYFEPIFQHVTGVGTDSRCFQDYYNVLTNSGLLQDCLELGGEGRPRDEDTFITFVRAHLDKFDENSIVRAWLATLG